MLFLKNMKRLVSLIMYFIAGYFICEKCCSKGEWNLLEKYVSLTSSSKSNNTLKELETLKNTVTVRDNYNLKWENITKSNQQIADLSLNLYEKILHTFSLPVRYNQVNKTKFQGIFTYVIIYNIMYIL